MECKQPGCDNKPGSEFARTGFCGIHQKRTAPTPPRIKISAEDKLRNAGIGFAKDWTIKRSVFGMKGTFLCAECRTPNIRNKNFGSIVDVGDDYDLIACACSQCGYLNAFSENGQVLTKDK